MPDPTIITQVSRKEPQLDGDLLLCLMGPSPSHYHPCCGLNSIPEFTGSSPQLHLFGARAHEEVIKVQGGYEWEIIQYD